MHAETIDAAITEIIKGTRESYQESNGKAGGHTASATGAPVPDSGFMVGGFAKSLIFDASLITDGEHDEVVWRMVFRWVADNYGVATMRSMFLGGWIDVEEGAAYIDMSQHYSDKDAAIEVAQFHEEIAIWDLAAGEEIRVS